MIRFCWAVTALMALAGMATVFASFTMGSAPQEAAAAAIGAGLAITPYVFTRSLEGIWGSMATRRIEEAIKKP